MVLASLLGYTLEEIARERVRLTVGPGYLVVGNIGRPRASVQTMRDAILIIRRLLRRERVTFNGVETQLRNVSDPLTPVYLTAAGPRMMELAGEVADGALLLVGLHPLAIAAARRRLEAGAQRSGRDLSGFSIIYITPTTVVDDCATARRAGHNNDFGPANRIRSTLAAPTYSGCGNAGSISPMILSPNRLPAREPLGYAPPSGCSARPRSAWPA